MKQIQFNEQASSSLSKLNNIKNWLLGKYDGLMIFLGLKIDGQWLLLKAIEKEFGSNAAKSCFVLSIMLGLKFGTKNNESTIRKIRKYTEKNNE